MENKIERVSLEGDEEVIGPICDWLIANFCRVKFIKKRLLKKIFPQPKQEHLRTFWIANSHADITAFIHGEPVCIIEPGGNPHFQDQVQITRDKKKYKICKDNGVEYLQFPNTIVNWIEDPKASKLLKKLFKKSFYGGRNGKTT